MSSKFYALAVGLALGSMVIGTSACGVAAGGATGAGVGASIGGGQTGVDQATGGESNRAGHDGKHAGAATAGD